METTVLGTAASDEAKLLLESLMTGYNKLIRPVHNGSTVLQVKLKLKLTQLYDVHEKNQIMTTNVWLTQEWADYNLRWDPRHYNGLRLLHIPADRIWIPDIVLYNNADGNYQVTIMTKADVHYNGVVVWEPPAIYRRFGSWTYSGDEVDLVHYEANQSVHYVEEGLNISQVRQGIDLSEFYTSIEWDIMETPSERHQMTFREGSRPPYIDITFYLSLRRKTLFYTINLIVPCVGISLLTAVVFYLPSASAQKVVLCISILISLTWFFLMLVDIIPSTSLVIPLIGLYLLFTMLMVTMSICITVITLHMHYRVTSVRKLPHWARAVFINFLPKILRMQRPGDFDRISSRKTSPKRKNNPADVNLPPFLWIDPAKLEEIELVFEMSKRVPANRSMKERMSQAADSVCYVAKHLQLRKITDDLREDWRLIARVLDRLLLWVFTLTCVVGSMSIILRSPVVFDLRQPLA